MQTNTQITITPNAINWIGDEPARHAALAVAKHEPNLRSKFANHKSLWSAYSNELAAAHPSCTAAHGQVKVADFTERGDRDIYIRKGIYAAREVGEMSPRLGQIISDTAYFLAGGTYGGADESFDDRLARVTRELRDVAVNAVNEWVRSLPAFANG